MRLSLFIFTILFAGVVQAQVYRSVDKDGNVIYSDKATEGAVEVEVKELETVKSLDTTPLPPSSSTRQKQQQPYTAIKVTSPKHDEIIRENTGNLSVAVTVTPGLRAGDQLVLYLDGAEYTTSQNPSFQLQNIDRGTHQIKVAAVDAAGQEQISSGAVTFHLQRFSVQNPNIAPKPPAKPAPAK